ncbi:MAG: transcriptional regulator [Nevskia sp.]|nr:transcriptional regulator [Nevskia sp.]
MKAARTAATKKTKAAPVAPKKATRRKRQTGVRARILAILAAGPITNSELQRKGRFTPSAQYLHLKALRQQGVLDSKRNGRSVTLRLKGKAHSRSVEEPIDAVVVQETPRRATSSALVPARMSPELHEALNAVAFRLRPVERVEEKLLVLDQLARSMPPTVSGVLHAVMADLVKLSTLQSASVG